MFSDVEKGNEDIFCITKQMKKSKNVVGECCVRDDQGHISLMDDAKKKAWRDNYNYLLTVQFSWFPEKVPPALPVEGPPIFITSNMVAEAISKMKQYKAPHPSCQKWLRSDKISIPFLASLMNAIIAEKKIPEDKDMIFVINLYKGQGDELGYYFRWSREWWR